MTLPSFVTYFFESSNYSTLFIVNFKEIHDYLTIKFTYGQDFILTLDNIV